MDLPWRKMSEPELNLLRGIAADLDTLSEPPIENATKEEAIIRPILTSLKEDEFGRALDLIRKHQRDLPSAVSSFWRGICCAGLGLYGAASEFFGHAATLYPVEPLFWTLWMDALMSDKRESEALSVAEQAIERISAPEVLMKAGGVIALNAELASQSDSEALHQKALAINTQGLERAQNDPRKHDELRDAIVKAHLHKAMSYIRLGELQAALKECGGALDIKPNSLEAMLVKGFLEEQAHERGSEARADIARCLNIPLERSIEAVRGHWLASPAEHLF
jgi:tetratricopeptide (TPR) repeat protein